MRICWAGHCSVKTFANRYNIQSYSAGKSKEKGKYWKMEKWVMSPILRQGEYEFFLDT